MANPLPLVSLPGYDLTFASGTSFAFADPDPDYPASNLLNGDPAVVAKSLFKSDVLTVTTASASVVAIVLVNTNARLATMTAPDTPSIAIPTADLDGQRINGWLDRRDNPLGPSTTFAIDLAGPLSPDPNPVWVGHAALLTALEPLNLKYGLQMGRRRPGDVEITTRLGSRIRMGAQIRTRWARGVVDLIEDDAFLHNLDASAKGTILPFIFIPDENTNDAWLVTFASSEFSRSIPNYDVREIPLAFEELSGGPPNG